MKGVKIEKVDEDSSKDTKKVENSSKSATENEQVAIYEPEMEPVESSVQVSTDESSGALAINYPIKTPPFIGMRRDAHELIINKAHAHVEEFEFVVEARSTLFFLKSFPSKTLCSKLQKK